MKHIFTIIFLLSFGYVNAQTTGIYSEHEISSHNLFMDALSEKYAGNSKKSIDLFRACLKEDNTNHAAAFELAKLYFEESNHEEAIRYGLKAIQQDAHNKWYLVFLANVYIDAFQFDEAIRLLKKLILKDPSNKYYYDQLSFVQQENNKPWDAILTLNSLEGIIGIDENVIRKKFELYKLINDNGRAESELVKLIKSDSMNTRYLNNLAQFYISTKRRSKAMEVFRQIIILNPDHARANIELAGENTQGNDGVSILSSLKDIMANKEIELDVKVKELIPFVEISSRQSDSLELESLEHLLGMLRSTHPKSAKVYAISGDFYNQIENDQEALFWYEKTLSVNDNIYIVWEQMMYVLVDIKNFQLLKIRSENAIDLFPNKTGAYILNAKALNELGEKKEAKLVLEEAKLIAGKNLSFLKQIEELEKEL